MNNALTDNKVFVMPGQRSIIDTVNPETGRSRINGESLEEIQKRYPGATVRDWDEFARNVGREQDEEPATWAEVTQERYYEMLEVLPPAAMLRGAFLVGEPMDHHWVSGKPRYSCFRQVGDRYEELSKSITVQEFKAMFQ